MSSHTFTSFWFFPLSHWRGVSKWLHGAELPARLNQHRQQYLRWQKPRIPAAPPRADNPLLPRQPARPVVALCTGPLWGRAWNNLWRSRAGAHWFKHTHAASALPSGLQNSPQQADAFWSLFLPGPPLQQPYLVTILSPLVRDRVFILYLWQSSTETLY